VNKDKKTDTRYVPSFCYQCNAGPDLLKVKVEDGVATEVVPNFSLKGVHPADGRVCVKAFGLVEKAYNPHRILTPMKRTNPNKGKHEDPGFVSISWDEAYDLIADKLNKIKETGLYDESGYPRTAVSIGEAGTPAYHMGTFMAFLVALGPIDYGIGAGQGIKCYHSEHFFGELWHRSYTVTADAPRCNYIISCGANTDASTGVVGVSRHANARSRGLKRIQVEPHLSVTGASADQWLPIKPKTDAAFLYALLYVLLHEHEVDELDIPFLKHRMASPYLIGPNGFYLRDPETREPLVWDNRNAAAVPHDRVDIDPALTGSFIIDALEIGADDEEWQHQQVKCSPAFADMRDMLKEYSPEWAETICDIPAQKIRRVANEFLEHAQIGATIEIEGMTLPYRPVAVVLGKTVNNGWGAYQCCWARTMLACLVGAFEVPGSTVGTCVYLNRHLHTRSASVFPGEDGFMKQFHNPTDRENWSAKPKSRNAYNTLVPLACDLPASQALGPAHLPWLFQDEPPENLPKPTVPDFWFIYRTNPGISSWDAPGVVEKMAKFPFIAAFAYTLDESNYMADVLLPDAMDLESTQLIRMGGTTYMEQYWYHQGFGLRQTVVPPRGEAKDFTEIATELAVRTGTLEAYNKMINKGLTGIKLHGENYNFSLDENVEHSKEEIWDAVCKAASAELSDGKESDGLDWYKENGYKFGPFSQLEWYLYPTMVEKKLRFELPYQERVFRIGKQLSNRLHEHGINWWDEQLTEYEAMPEWHDFPAIWEKAAVKEGETIDDYPFWLITARSMQYAWGNNLALPFIHELGGNVAGHRGLVINPVTAEKLGINDGDLIEISSSLRSARGRAELRQGIRPDTLLAIGQFGHWATPIAKEVEIPSVNSLTPISIDLTDANGSSSDVVRVSLKRISS
jgi:phenylacetyl-CoA:acceptor oxidoreductase